MSEQAWWECKTGITLLKEKLALHVKRFLKFIFYDSMTAPIIYSNSPTMLSVLKKPLLPGSARDGIGTEVF